ncbi:MAG: hypothetical protein Q4C45_08000 [Oscillospiraceae bacterium]|nr:hypothetical protein [Oscillospiraceae bacterium]
MEGAIFGCPAGWAGRLPPGTRRLTSAEELEERVWTLLALTASGCGRLGERPVRCGTLLVPGDCPPAELARVRAEAVISCGLSPRDSLTLSSLESPVLCVQRALPRPDGGIVEPQEFPLPDLPEPAEELLLLLGLRLLQMPLTTALRLW